jgi:hypothetical protein
MYRQLLATTVTCLVLATDLAAEPAPSENAASSPAPRNGKQISRIGKSWLSAGADAAAGRLLLFRADDPPAQSSIRAWQPLAFASRGKDGLFPLEGGNVTAPSLALDRQERLHVAWESGGAVWHARSSSGKERLADRHAWTSAAGERPAAVILQARLGDIAVTERGDIWLAAVRTTSDSATVICLAHYTDKWQVHELAQGKGYRPPVFDVRPDGTAHLTWADDWGRVFYQQYRQGAIGPVETIARSGWLSNGKDPVIATVGDQVLIVYANVYAELQYALQEHGKWKIAYVPDRRKPDPRFGTDILHSPQLAVDAHGVVWLVFADATRKYTYFTRWLGSGWSDIYDARGIFHVAPHFESNYLSPDTICLEKKVPAGVADLGLFLGHALVPDHSEFHRLSVATPAPQAGATVLFMDLLEVARLEGLELILNEAKRHPSNPLFTPGPEGAFDSQRVFNHGTVLWDQGKFRMWYTGLQREKGKPWWEWEHAGYAESKDGLQWMRVDVPQPHGVTGKDRNRFADLAVRPRIFKDDSNPDPKQRYQAIYFPPHGALLELAAKGEYSSDSPKIPGQRYYSPDGMNWTSEPITVEFRGGKPSEFVPQSWFRDPQEQDESRRWKAYGWSSQSLRRRAPSFAYSKDAKTWTAYARNPILDPSVSAAPMMPSGPQNQIHDLFVWPYAGYYLGMFQYQHGPDFLDIELAMSRDGEHFVHIKPERKLIAAGKPGDFDWQWILPSMPLTVRDELWLYYGGLGPPLGKRAEPPVALSGEHVHGSVGLATLRRDGFTHVQLPAGTRTGQLTTVPFVLKDRQPLRLHVNAECSPQARLTIELLDAETGQPLAGYSRSDNTPCQANGVRQIVRWGERDVVPALNGKRLALRFWFEGDGVSPKLYAYGWSDGH